MSVYLCHEEPELLEFDAEVIECRSGAVALSRSALHPGGGGQVCDRARIRQGNEEFEVVSVCIEAGRWWHITDRPIEFRGPVSVRIDAEHRRCVSQLHTDTHILNALVFQAFSGAKVTGCQINGDGTARMDFDVPEADNDRLRALEPVLNDIIRQGLDVRAIYIPAQDAQMTPGLIRSLSVAPPPTPDGRMRIIEIAGLDRQACGGTHLKNTRESSTVRFTKIENKGRHNRRIRLALA